MLNFTQLRAFHEIAKSLSFSSAAKNLFVTQPAVTKQIKMLQESCKLKLFVQSRGRVFLTDEGRKIFIYASRIFELERQLEETIGGIQNLKQGSLRLGTIKTFAKHFMPLIMSSFRKSFPGIIIELDEGSSQSMTESLLDFTNTLAIVTKVVENPEIVYTPLVSEQVILIASPEHRLANLKELDLRDLAAEPMALSVLGSGPRNLVEQLARNEEIKLNVIAQTSNLDFIKQLVIREKAISLVLKSAVQVELARGELKSIPVRFLGRLEISIAYLRDYELPVPARVFLEHLLPLAHPDLPDGIDSFAHRLEDIWNSDDFLSTGDA